MNDAALKPDMKASLSNEFSRTAPEAIWKALTTGELIFGRG